MKNLAPLILALFIGVNSFAQSAGTINYTETVKLDIKLPDGLQMDGMMDQSLTVNTQLHFNPSISHYSELKDNESSDREFSSDDGGFQIVMKMDDTEDIFYTDLNNKLSLHQTSFMGKEFLISAELIKPKWKLTGEKIKYLGYVCQKAEMTLVEDEKEKNVVAWFTSEIPVAIGPDKYNQLPGAILMISVDNGKKEIKATKVELKPNEETLLEQPKNGKKVSMAEYEEIIDKKMKELEENAGTHIIRG